MSDLPQRTIEFMKGYWNVDRPIKEFCSKMERELMKAEKERDAAWEALMRIEEIFVDGDDTYEDWKAMGDIVRKALEVAK